MNYHFFPMTRGRLPGWARRKMAALHMPGAALSIIEAGYLFTTSPALATCDHPRMLPALLSVDHLCSVELDRWLDAAAANCPTGKVPVLELHGHLPGEKIEIIRLAELL